MTDGVNSYTLQEVRYDSDIATTMVEELQQEYVIRYGGRDATTVEPDQFAPPSGAFFIVYVDGEPAGCSGLRRHDDDNVEVKRMFVRRPFRGRGLSRWLLAQVEERGRALGYRRMLMETGQQQPEAMHLYETSGYEPIPGFGHYAQAPENRCYAKDL